MANRLKMKQSSVAGKVPATTDLLLGELAVNTTDGKLYLKKNVSGTETIVDVTAGGLLPATASNLGGVKGLTNLTIDGVGNLSMLAANIAGALGYAPQPTGIMQQFAGATAPIGWLLCDGAAVSRTSYASLFAVVGTTYGAGDGSTTFNVPNMKDRVPVGAGTSHTLGATGGAAAQTPAGSVSVANTSLTTAQLPAHNHGISDPGHSHTVYDPQHNHGLLQGPYDGGGNWTPPGSNTAFGTNATTNYSPTGIGINVSGTGISTTNTGSGTGHNHTATFTGSALSVEQPYTVVNFIIKA